MTVKDVTEGAAVAVVSDELVKAVVADAASGGVTHAAAALRTYPTRISQLERGQYHNHHLATQYHQWLTTVPSHRNPIRQT